MTDDKVLAAFKRIHKATMDAAWEDAIRMEAKWWAVYATGNYSPSAEEVAAWRSLAEKMLEASMASFEPAPDEGDW